MKVRLFVNRKDLLEAENLDECILVRSFQDYKKLGGARNMFDSYAAIKARAKEHELNFIQLMDMSLSGIEVPVSNIELSRRLAQTYWNILSLWFSFPARTVSFRNFDLKEFNNL